MVGTILGMLGHQVTDDTLKEIIDEVDVDGKNAYATIFFPFGKSMQNYVKLV